MAKNWLAPDNPRKDDWYRVPIISEKNQISQSLDYYCHKWALIAKLLSKKKFFKVSLTYPPLPPPTSGHGINSWCPLACFAL